MMTARHGRLEEEPGQDDLLDELRGSALALMAMLIEKPMTGYEIKKLADSRELGFWGDSFGSIYPNLRHLRKLGLICETSTEETGRRRVEYALTDEGRRLVGRWLSLPADRRPPKIEMLLKLRFAYAMGSRVLADLLREHLASQKAALPDLYEDLQHIDGLEQSLQLATRRMTVDFWYRFTRMMIEWSRASLERLERLDPPDNPPR
jgi:DNA-binding PadR family transcriptional regulator